MNHRERFLLGLVLVFGLALAAQAQTTILPAWRTAASLDATQVATIKKFVEENVAALDNADPDAVRQARENLIDRTAKPVGADLSVAFANAYSEALNAETLKLLSKTKAIRPRLNAAVVVARVAENTRSAQLEKVVLNLLAADQSEALKLWGVRAGRAIVPALITVNAHKELVNAIMNAVTAHPTGAMTQEAYFALTGDISPTVSEKVVAPLMALVKARVDVYAKQLAEDPSAEGTALYYLTHPDVWARLSPPQRLEVMQLLADTLVLMARHGDAVAMEIRTEITGAMNRIAQGGIVIFKMAKVQPAEAEFDKIYRYTRPPANVKLVELTANLHEILSRVPGFEGIKPPPAPVAAKAP